MRGVIGFQRCGVISAGILSVLLLFVWPCPTLLHGEPSPQVQPQGGAQLRIGAILPLTGFGVQWGGYLRQGMELAVEDVNREDRSFQVALRIEDDHSIDKRASLAATHKLLEVEKVDVVTLWSLSALELVLPLTKKARVPLFVGDYDERISRAGGDTFGAIVNRDLVPREVARFFQARGAQRVALVMVADAWSANYEAPFRAEAQRLGLDLVHVETVNPDEGELRPVVLRLKAKGVDAVLAPLYGASLFSFLRRHRELQAGGIINVGDALFEQDVATLGAVAEGVTSQQITVEDAEFAEKVRKRYGISGDPLQLGMIASGYDPVRHLAKAARELRSRGEPVTRARLAHILKTYRSDGYLGPLMAGAPPETAGEQIVVVENGRYRRVR